MPCKVFSQTDGIALLYKITSFLNTIPKLYCGLPLLLVHSSQNPNNATHHETTCNPCQTIIKANSIGLREGGLSPSPGKGGEIGVAYHFLSHLGPHPVSSSF